jgi:CheY-like chemotaxis protein/HEAT repeat protein
MCKLKSISTCLAIALVFACGVTARAQQPKTTPKKPPVTKPAVKRPAATAAPKPAATHTAPTPADKPADAAPPAAPPVAAPVPPATPDKDTAKKAPAGPADIGPKPETDPAVLSALEMPHKKPADFVQSILLLIDLGRPELAKPILADLTKLELTDAQRQELVDEFGAGNMLKLSHSKELAPEGATFADACMAVASAITNNPQRIATLIGQLSDPSPETRLLAQHDLAATGPKAATATLETFAKEPDRNRRAALAAGIAPMHPFVDGMLLAMLDTHDPVLRADVADLLRQLQVPQAQPLVTASDAAAEHEISTALSSYERGTPIFLTDQDNQVELWQWNDATKQLSSARIPAAEARIVWMSKLARTLTQLQPQNPDYQRRALVLAWEAESSKLTPRNWPVNPKFISRADPQFLNDVLTESLKNNHSHAAISAIKAMAERHDPSVLMTSDGKPSPLASALGSPNRNVRFAALTAIMALDPASPYPGSSRVPEALAWFAASSADQRALVAMPTRAAATDLAGQLVPQKFTAEATNSGRELIALARDTTDVEAIFVDMDIIAPHIREVLYELRMNPATGEVPIAIMAAEGRLDAAKKLAEEHQRVIAVPRLHSDEVLTKVVQQMAALNDRDAVPANERVAQATQAKAWLTKLESGGRPFYVIRRMARLTPAAPHRDAPENLPKP